MRKYAIDPNGLGRGAGYYYLRGGKRDGNYTLPSGRVVKGPYYSKYDVDRDHNIYSRGHKVDKVGVPKEDVFAYGHTTDGNLNGGYKRKKKPTTKSKPKSKKKPTTKPKPKSKPKRRKK
jgi:hypothetical protein